MLIKVTPKPLRWQKSQSSPLNRQIDVFSAAGQFIFYLWLDRLFQNYSHRTKKLRAEWLVKTLLNLGPTFIKIGQALSTRADIIPIEYVNELQKLQDKVPEFDSAEAIALIESELGKEIFALYRDFDHFPIAAASLGQVHKARLHTGEDVVVKVQRPGLQDLFDLDAKAIYNVIKFCQRFFPWTRKYDLDELYKEFFTILYQEIDYVREGKNAERFANNFLGYPQILIPKVYWRYTTKKVLTVEYLPGIKVDDKSSLEAIGVDVKKLNQLGISCYLKQLLQDGFFQADPHPGNMAVTPDGSLIFYDFGMMAEVKSLAKDQMIRTFFGVLRKDTDEVLETLILMGLIEPVSDMMPVRRMVTFLLERFTEKPIDFQEFNEIKDELYMMFEQQPFRLPGQMMFIMKALTTLDGIARSLDAQYNPVACAKPFIKSLTHIEQKDRVNLVGELVRQARNYVQFRLKQPSKAEVLIRHLEKRLEEGELQVRVRNIESDRALKRVNMALKCVIYACLTGFAFLSGAVLMLSYQGGAIAAFAMSAFTGCFLLRSMFDLWMRENLDKLVEK
jgi:predicted unusual protein kinase regulating ubiquinone biosynthesis (AarF/ABC1/UbiB family)